MAQGLIPGFSTSASFRFSAQGLHKYAAFWYVNFRFSSFTYDFKGPSQSKHLKHSLWNMSPLSATTAGPLIPWPHLTHWVFFFVAQDLHMFLSSILAKLPTNFVPHSSHLKQSGWYCLPSTFVIVPVRLLWHPSQKFLGPMVLDSPPHRSQTLLFPLKWLPHLSQMKTFLSVPMRQEAQVEPNPANWCPHWAQVFVMVGVLASWEPFKNHKQL
jgi:hypothetical protein